MSDQYDTMPAGNEIDRLVAERVMGWQVLYARLIGLDVVDTSKPGVSQIRIFAPSTIIAHAWEVVERMRNRGLGVLPRDDGWVAGWEGEAHVNWYEQMLYGGEGTWSFADTAPLAICRAALKAVGA